MDETIEEAIQQLRLETVNMTIHQLVRTASGRWIVDTPVPTLQLPPPIQRLHFGTSLNPNAEPFVPTAVINAATKITAVAKGFLVRRHQQIHTAAEALTSLSR